MASRCVEVPAQQVTVACDVVEDYVIWPMRLQTEGDVERGGALPVGWATLILQCRFLGEVDEYRMQGQVW